MWLTYPYHVKANGKYYAPGEEIKDNDTPEAKKDKDLENRPLEKTKGRRRKE